MAEAHTLFYTPTHFEVAGITYQARRMKPLPQIHVMRRLAAVIPKLQDYITTIAGAAKDGGQASAPDLKQRLMALGPITDAIASLSNDDAEYVINQCLLVCERKNGDFWGPVFNEKLAFRCGMTSTASACS